jgi:surfactin synthase thioesterase subunit
MEERILDSWRVAFVERPDARVRLYCFPFAGGGAPVFRPWALGLPAWVELRAVKLPGRHDRSHEPACSSLISLAENLADVLRGELADRPFAFFGHSMGALVAYEVARQLRRRGGSAPRLLAVSGRHAPHLPDRSRPVHLLPDAEFIEAVGELGGMPAEVLRDDQLIALALPVLRADFAACHGYHHVPEAPLECPISVFGGQSDPLLTPEERTGWQRHSTAQVTSRVYSGGHFYLFDHEESMLSALVMDLAHAVRPGHH